jgi:hypothetical protein
MAKHFTSYQRPNGTWRCQLRAAGKRGGSKDGFATQAEADAWGEQQGQALAPAGRQVTAHLVTIGDALRMYRRDILPHRKGWRFEERRMPHFLEHRMAATRLTGDVTGALQDWLNERVQGTKKHKPVKPQTALRELAIIGGAFSELMREPYRLELPGGHPTRLLRRPKVKEIRQTRIWTEAEFELFLDYFQFDLTREPVTKSDHVPWLLVALKTTGLRPSTVMATRVEWVDLAGRVIHYPEGAVKNAEPYECPLDDGAVTFYTALLRHREGHELLFDGGQDAYNSMASLFARARASLAVQHPTVRGLTIYGQRHTWTTANARHFKHTAEFLTYTGRKSIKDALKYMKPTGRDQAEMIEQRRREAAAALAPAPAVGLAELMALVQQQAEQIAQLRP